ncbi:PD-(D/E)XK motif protein [Intrasporangium sp. YIM S08009]|uniref:PD-(D/E)XK motif protein n=1 Tax=Intrasporangium zincisolvens TaxID=3080018 RepID=UPI002B057045|nr:PD-(D/E)XK motif protein [Intrasporangium sp. YIM S08009]
MSKRDLDGIWTVLSTSPPTLGITVAPTGYQVAAGPLLAGIDSERRRHLLIPLSAGEAARTDTKGKAVHLARVAHDGTDYLTVFCLLPHLHHVFSQFCRELVESVEEVGSPAGEASKAFDRWRALFSDAQMQRGLPDETLTGLVGELLVLEALLKRGAPADLGFWTGPFSEIHDFRSATHAVEVKATLVREGRIVHIANVDQLQEPSGADLTLVHIRLDRDANGFDLETLAHRALSAGAVRTELSRRLAELGADLDDMRPYATRKFRLVERRTYDVSRPAFPRLLRSSFAAGDLPPGTLHVTYSIDLTNEPPHPLTGDEEHAALEALAKEAADAVDP